MHQLSHMWIDFRGIQDAFMRRHAIDYFENSRRATYVQPAVRDSQSERLSRTTASTSGASRRATVLDRRRGACKACTRRFLGYLARGVPYGPDDGTLAPWAVAASLPFAPEIVLPTLAHCSKAYPNMESEYGLVCSFNPTFPSRGSKSSGWVSTQSLRPRSGPCHLDDRELSFGIDLAPHAAAVHISLTAFVARDSWAAG